MESMERRAATPDNMSVKSSSPTAAGSKRKRGNEPKFYAVRVGFKPGIYHTWADCLAQVKGYKKSMFKSFTSLRDAESFLAGGDPSSDPSSSSFQSYKFYAVQNGRVPGVYTDWPSAQAQITGWTKPKHRVFSSKAEAEAFVKARSTNSDVDGLISEVSQPKATKEMPDRSENKTKTMLNPPSKKQKRNSAVLQEEDMNASLEPGTGPLPKGAFDGFDPNITLNPETGEVEYKTKAQLNTTKLQASGPKPNTMLRIFTDGSALGNGRGGAVAGVGVFFGPMDERNVSEALPGPRQTNQRAELTAILRALDIAPRHRDICILTDSRYAIDCVTVWYINWRRNNWQTANKKPVENKDIIENILAKIEERNALKVKTNFEWLKGHANLPGNVEADKLAVDGARNARGV